ncbi:MAG TPA: AAA family ATPase [Clostridiaceae bacterium]|nr:AAA family ATPase [Clostridiaceae bacterium]
MKRLTLIIVDEEKEYVDALSDFILENFPGKFSIYSFTNKTIFTKYMVEEYSPYDILLINPSLYDESLPEGKQGIVIFLAETIGDNCRDGNKTAIYKYQSGRAIVQEIVRIYSERRNTGKYITGNVKETKVIAVYSPAGGTGKTTLALSIGICCAKKSLRTLYINLEDIYSAGQFFDTYEKPGLSNIIYYSKLMNKDILSKIEEIKCIDPNYSLCYIGPPDSVLDLDELEPEDLQYILKELKQSGIYDLIIVDMSGGSNKKNFTIFDASDEIIFVLSQEQYCHEKTHMIMKELERYCQKAGTDYLYKIVPVVNKYKVSICAETVKEGTLDSPEKYNEDLFMGKIEYKIPYVRRVPFIQSIPEINLSGKKDENCENFIEGIMQLVNRYV